MNLSDLKALKDLSLHILYLLIFRLYIVVQLVYRKLVNIDEIKRNHARVASILFRRKRDPEEIGSVYDFVTYHESFEPLDFLTNYWGLYSLNRDIVMFIELPKPVTHYDSKRYPFIYVPFFDEARRVAYVNFEDFIAYCNRICTRPQPRTVLFTNTGRCGSTLLAQMLSLDNISVCYAEPHVFKILSVGYHEGIYSEEFTRAAVSAAITYFRRDVPRTQVCVIKTTSSEIRLVPLTSNVTNLQHIFMFRKNGVSSMEKLLLRDRAMRYLLELYKLFPLLCDAICCRLIAGDGDYIKKLTPRNVFEHAAVNYAAPYSHYLKNKDKFEQIVWYHDLMNDTKATLTNLFEKLRIPVSCVEAAIKCKDYDSQDGTFISRKALAGIKTTEPTELQKERLIQYCEIMEIPKFILLGDQ